jgi:signal transduction histidine kinase
MSLNRFGFDTVHINGEEYRTFSLPSKNREFIVQVAENIDERWAQVGLVTGYYVGFLLIPFALVSGATWLFLRRSLHSIDTLADDLRDRNPLDVSPLKVDTPPEEILPILKSLDTLLARYGRAFSEERKFTSVAAHEMRTPLAGLRAHAQLAVSSTTDEGRNEGLMAVIRGVDRASHMLDQLLDLARIEGMPQEARNRLEIVNVSDTYQGVMADVGPKGSRKSIVFSARFAAPEVRCHGFAFYLLMRNLLANAILYTPASGRVEVSTFRDGEAVVLVVDDSGPGIAPDDREHAFERFNRLHQTQLEGVGLGLSIVLSVVELHHGRIQLLGSPYGGLRVQVTFPEDERGSAAAAQTLGPAH